MNGLITSFSYDSCLCSVGCSSHDSSVNIVNIVIGVLTSLLALLLLLMSFIFWWRSSLELVFDVGSFCGILCMNREFAYF